MKKLIVTSLLSLTVLVFSSFMTLKPAGVSFHDQGTEYFTQTLVLCNGDIVEMDFRVDIDVHGVQNQNRYMIDGEYHFTASGTDMVSGEVYTLDTYSLFHDNVPILRGAAVLRSQWNEVITGSLGSLQTTTFGGHLTFNAKGALVADHFEATANCK